MSENESYRDTVASFYRRSNDVQKYVEALEKLAENKEHLKFGSAKTCLAIGTGVGMYELMFIKRFMPNIQKIVAVEPDPPSVTDLRRNIQEHLPNVESVIYEKSAQDYLHNVDHNSESYDSILILQCLYYLEDADRQALFKLLFDRLLASDGAIFISHCFLSVYPGDIYRFIWKLNPSYKAVLTDVVEKDFTETGFKNVRQIDYFMCTDCSNPDDELVNLFALHLINKPVTKKEFEEAVRRNCPSEKMIVGYSLYVLEKP